METKKARYREKVKWWLPGVEGGRNREILAKGYEFPVIKYVSWKSTLKKYSIVYPGGVIYGRVK